MMNKLYFDGSFTDGGGAYSFNLNNTVIERGPLLHCRDNVEAEYQALIHGLRKAHQLRMWQITILGDSKTVLHQLTGQMKTRRHRKLREEALCLLLPLDFTLEWIPRSKNIAH